MGSRSVTSGAGRGLIWQSWVCSRVEYPVGAEDGVGADPAHIQRGAVVAVVAVVFVLSPFLPPRVLEGDAFPEMIMVDFSSLRTWPPRASAWR